MPSKPTTTTATATATEVPDNRRWSRIGTVQRHYRLSAPLRGEDGMDYTDAVVVDAYDKTLVYPGTDVGCVADYRCLGRTAGVDDAAALAALGYRIA
jgi:hypothetical protein